MVMPAEERLTMTDVNDRPRIARWIISARARRRLAACAILLDTAADYATFHRHAAVEFGDAEPLGPGLVAEITGLLWRNRDGFLEEAAAALRAVPAARKGVAASNPDSAPADRQSEPVVEAAPAKSRCKITAVLTADTAWVDAATRRDPAWGRKLVRALDGWDVKNRLQVGLASIRRQHDAALQEYGRECAMPERTPGPDRCDL
jgi:hypothetical protein